MIRRTSNAFTIPFCALPIALSLVFILACGGVSSLLEGKDAKKFRKITEAATGCETRIEKSCKIRYVRKKRFLFGDKIEPVEDCKEIPVQNCPGDRRN